MFPLELGDSFIDDALIDEGEGRCLGTSAVVLGHGVSYQSRREGAWGLISAASVAVVFDQRGGDYDGEVAVLGGRRAGRWVRWCAAGGRGGVAVGVGGIEIWVYQPRVASQGGPRYDVVGAGAQLPIVDAARGPAGVAADQGAPVVATGGPNSMNGSFVAATTDGQNTAAVSRHIPLEAIRILITMLTRRYGWAYE